MKTFFYYSLIAIFLTCSNSALAQKPLRSKTAKIIQQKKTTRTSSKKKLAPVVKKVFAGICAFNLLSDVTSREICAAHSLSKILLNECPNLITSKKHSWETALFLTNLVLEYNKLALKPRLYSLFNAMDIRAQRVALKVSPHYRYLCKDEMYGPELKDFDKYSR